MDFTDMTDQEIFEYLEQAQNEIAGRQTRAALEQEADQVILKARENGAAHRPPHHWRAVRIDEAFALGETTVKNGTRYVSRIPNNVCIPGECKTGWVQDDEPDDGEH